MIRFGENLLDLKKYSKAEDIKTAIIPLGAVVDNKNVDIKAANGHDGTDYVYNQEAVNLHMDGFMIRLIFRIFMIQTHY